MSDHHTAYETLINKITLAEFNTMYAMFCNENPNYDIAVEHVVRVNLGFVVVYTMSAKSEHRMKSLPISHNYQRCVFVIFNQEGECHEHSNMNLG